jgi:transglutaminase-like putative cysteine protease
LWSIIAKHTGEPMLVDFAANVIREQEIPANNSRELARFLQKYVQQNVKFFREYPERWQSPLRTLKWGIGDCDDQAILLATTLRSFRVPVRLKFVRFVDPKHRARKSHVYTQAKLGNEWVSLETVKPVALGYDPEQRMREQGIRVLGVDLIGDK